MVRLKTVWNVFVWKRIIQFSFVTKLMRFIAKINSITVVGFVKKQVCVCVFVCLFVRLIQRCARRCLWESSSFVTFYWNMLLLCWDDFIHLFGSSLCRVCRGHSELNVNFRKTHTAKSFHFQIYVCDAITKPMGSFDKPTTSLWFFYFVL